MDVKPYTNYECASGNTGLGHSSLYTGASTSGTGSCCCGEPFVEVVPDGFRYKVVFESINQFQAAEMVARYGKDIWQRLSDEQWKSLDWTPPITSDQGTPNELRGQYRNLLRDAQTREQPIRNVHFYKAADSHWTEVEI